jgi:putative DNA primase/helicase
MYGGGANGKSTALDVLEAMIGRENVSRLSLTDLMQRFKSHGLQGKLINMATETNTRDTVATDLLKAIIAGEEITAERKYGEQFEFRNFAKFIAAMNEPPIVPDKSYGFARRIIVLNFTRRFEGAEIDPNMSAKLIEEIDGVFNWALEGLYYLLEHNAFFIPEQVDKETKLFMTTLNPMLIFMEETCELNPDKAVSTVELWEKYKDWCEEGGNRRLSRNKFYDQVVMSFPQVTRDQWGVDRVQSFIGLEFK